MNRRRLLLSTAATATLAAACTTLAFTPAHAAVSEAQVKAAYLYKFASFVRWPPAAFTAPAAPLRICIAGGGDIHGIVAALARGQQAGGRPLAVEAIDPARADGVARCHLLYAGSGGSRALLDEAAKHPILTVTDRGTGGRAIIEFRPSAGSVRFQIDRRLAQQRQLVLSSKLLAVAVGGE